MYSPTYTRVMSITTSLSSTLPSTPPPHRMSLYACIPLPPQINGHDGHVTLHPLLQYNHARKLDFDLLDPRQCHAQLKRWGDARHEPATDPPLPSLVLLIEEFPWPIIAHASSVRRGVTAVTILDVITELCRVLQLPAAEYATPDGLVGSTRGVDRQYSEDGPVLQRMEYLRGRSMLVGLSQSCQGNDTVEVHVE